MFIKVRQNGFTLIEVVTASVIFGMICIATTTLLISAQRSWNRQIAQIKMLEADSWNMQRLTAELRSANASSVANAYSGNVVKFDIDTNGDNLTDTSVYYWIWRSGCPAGSTQANDDNKLYRAAVSPTNANTTFCPPAANTSVAVNTFSGVTFDNSPGGGVVKVTINSNGHYSNDHFIFSNTVDDLNFSLSANVRARN